METKKISAYADSAFLFAGRWGMYKIISFEGKNLLVASRTCKTGEWYLFADKDGNLYKITDVGKSESHYGENHEGKTVKQIYTIIKHDEKWDWIPKVNIISVIAEIQGEMPTFAVGRYVPQHDVVLSKKEFDVSRTARFKKTTTFYEKN